VVKHRQPEICNKMKKILKVLQMVIVWLLLATPGRGQTKVPYDQSSVMIDGRFEPKEWRGALKVKVNDSMSLYVKQDKENLYWCLHAATPRPVLLMVDFYLAQDSRLLNLHASAKLAERPWQDSTYGGWTWWNNRGWQATVARPDQPENRMFLPDQAKEFQLRKSRFSGKEMRLMFEISHPHNLVLKFPAHADTAHAGQWLWLQL
jgi:hypothetical protein